MALTSVGLFWVDSHSGTNICIVVEATGSVRILEDSINYVRRGGTLVVYGVYANADRVSWPPSKIFGDEITILGSFSETYMFRKSCLDSCSLLFADSRLQPPPLTTSTLAR